MSRLYHQKQICCDWDQNKKLKTDLIKYINNLDSKKNEVVEPFPILSITDDPKVHLKTAQHYAKTIQSKIHQSLIINKHNEYIGKITIYDTINSKVDNQKEIKKLLE